MTQPLDPQVAELVSAYLDGAVTDEEREVAAAWIERSPEARAEYESLAAVKATLGGLGEVDPPFGFYDRMLSQGTPTPVVTSAVDRPRRHRGRWLAAGGAIVAAAAAFVVVAGSSETVTPPVDEVAAGDAPGIVALRAGGEPIAAVAQDADAVRWSRLPEGLRETEGDAEIWVDLTTTGSEVRVVVFEDGVLVTLSADDVAEAELIEAGRQLAKETAEDRGILDDLQELAEKIWPG